jgi:hypothetical protein
MGGSVRRVLARPAAISVAVTIAALLVTFALRPGSVHPQLSRQSVIEAALTGYKPGQFSRVEAKLMYRRDFQRADPGWSTDNPSQLIWVVAVAGNYGISPSFGCCSVPADYPGHNTWGLAVFVDQGGPPHANEFQASYHGDWPPFFDSLPDLMAGR